MDAPDANLPLALGAVAVVHEDVAPDQTTVTRTVAETKTPTTTTTVTTVVTTVRTTTVVEHTPSESGADMHSNGTYQPFSLKSLSVNPHILIPQPSTLNPRPLTLNPKP